MTQWRQSMRESWIDRQIREAEERGEFDDLPGKGKPLPDLDRPRDDNWWVKQLVRREKLSVTPETLSLRKERERVREQALGARSASEARRVVVELNEQIRAFNARPTTGPPSDLTTIDADEVVREWQARKERPSGR